MGQVVLYECVVHGDVHGEVMLLASYTPRLVKVIVCLKKLLGGRLGTDSFTLFATILQVSTQGMSPANSHSLCVWIFREHLPSGYAKQAEKSGLVKLD